MRTSGIPDLGLSIGATLFSLAGSPEIPREEVIDWLEFESEEAKVATITPQMETVLNKRKG
jgi:hypothetical protein